MTIFILLMAGNLFAANLVKIDTENFQETQQLFNNEHLRINYYTDNFVLATSENDLTIEYDLVSSEPWKTGKSYYLLWLNPENRNEYISAIDEFSEILYESETYLIVEVVDEETRKLFPAVHNGIIHISNIQARLPESKRFGLRDVEENPFVYELMAQVSEDSLMENIQHLEDYGTRNCYEEESFLAQDWIYSKFESFGLDTELQDFTMPAGEASDNVIATLPGTVYPDEYVVLGAHYDSYSYSNAAPGADDNATGTCGIIETARILSQYTFDKTIIFCAFSGEEYGLYGSEAYASQAEEDGMNILGYFNIDMAGYLHPGDEIHTDMINPESAQDLADFYEEVAGVYLPDFGVFPGTLIGGDSDHTSFNNHGYMGIFPFEDSENYSPYIHSPDDLIGPSVNSSEMVATFTKATLASVVTMANPHSAQVEGQIFDSITEEGIQANILDNLSGYEMETDETGNFSMYLIPGDRTFTVESFGYYTAETPEVTATDTAVTYLEIYMDPLPEGSLSGMITDAATELPIENAELSFPETPIQSAYTDASGYYNFSDIPGDWNYQLQISGDEYEQIVEPVFVQAETPTVFDAQLNFVTEFEGDNGNFGGEGDWEWGIPTEDGGPADVHSGEKCWGTNIDDVYDGNSNRYLYSDIYQIGDPANAAIKFYHWYEIKDGWDGGNVQLTVNEGDWELIYPEDGYPDNSVVALSGSAGYTGDSDGWEVAMFDISEWVSVNDEIQVRFRFASTNSQKRGWFIDDFILHGNTEEPSVIDSDESAAAPLSYRLYRNYPNPFNPTTTIQYDLPESAKISLKIYDISGKLIRTLKDDTQDAGYHSIVWNGTDDTGNKVNSGIYIYRLESKDYTENHRMILLK